ncbi:MAG TPA: superoxide dismutase [Micromonosporaceae bacterium]
MRVRLSRIILSIITAGSVAVLAAPAAGAAPAAAPSTVFPTTLHLPNAFLPEGIAIGVPPFAYFGSRADGDLFRVNLLTGKGDRFSQGPGTPSVGLKVDPAGRLFVAGGPAGNGRVVSAFSGKVLASYQFTTAPTFVNDVVLTPTAAWFTDSSRPMLYKLPLGPGGRLPTQAQVVTVPLGGEWEQVAGFNANGIARTPDGSALLVVNSTTGRLFRVDPGTGVATAVDLGGETLVNGDGLLADGTILYAVQNQFNTLAVVRLNADGTAGEVVNRYTNGRFDTPTTVARYDGRLYLVNARFNTPVAPDTTYTAEAVPIAEVLGG